MPAEPEAVDEVTVFADGEDPAEGEVEQMLARIVPGTALHPRTGACDWHRRPDPTIHIGQAGCSVGARTDRMRGGELLVTALRLL